MFHDGNGELGRYYFRPTWRGAHYFSEKFFRAREQIRARDCGKEFHEFLHCAYRDEVAGNLQRVQQLAAQLPVLFTIHPVLPEGTIFPNYPHQRIHDDLADLARGLDFHVIDLAGAYEGYSGAEVTVPNDRWYDPWHPNEIGHRLAAEMLLAEVSRKDLMLSN